MTLEDWEESLLYPAPKVGTMETSTKKALLVWSSRMQKVLDNA